MNSRKTRPIKQAATPFRNTVMTLVERGGSASSFHVDGTTLADVMPIVRDNVKRETAIMTDEASWYRWVGKDYASHDTIEHTADEYVRRQKTFNEDGSASEERIITINSVEGYYSVFKRGMKGIYQHCSERHLHRYLAEFDFRYSNRVRLGVDDVERADRALKGIVGKRLTYRTSRQ